MTGANNGARAFVSSVLPFCPDSPYEGARVIPAQASATDARVNGLEKRDPRTRHFGPVSTPHTLMSDPLDDAKRVYVFPTTWFNGVGTSYELCVRRNRMRVCTIVVVAAVFGSFLLLYRCT